VPAEVQVGRSDGWLLNDRIRLIDLLRESPATAGFFYACSPLPKHYKKNSPTIFPLHLAYAHLSDSPPWPSMCNAHSS